MTTNGSLLRFQAGIRPQVVLWMLFMAGVIIIGFQRIVLASLRNKFLFVCLAFAGVSALWSETPSITVRSTIELTLTTIFALYLSERFTTEHLMNLLMFVGTVGGILSILLVIFLPDYGIYYRGGGGEWQGICSHKNALGVSNAFLLTPVFFVRKRMSLKIAYSILLLFLIGMSRSRGAWFVTLGVLAFAAWFFMFRRLRGRESILLFAGTVAAVVGVVSIAMANLGSLMISIGKDPTLTGRTDIYEAVLKSMLKQPILGYGYGAFWNGFNHESLNISLGLHWANIGYAENGFLELGLQLGGIGLALMFIMFGKAIWQSVRLIRAPHYNAAIGWFTMLIFLELISNVEAGIVLGACNINWTLTLIAVIGLGNEVRKANKSKGVASRQTYVAPEVQQLLVASAARNA